MNTTTRTPLARCFCWGVSSRNLASKGRCVSPVIVESENIFTLRGRTPHYTFVGAGLPSPYDHASCENNYRFYYRNVKIIVILFFIRYSPLDRNRHHFRHVHCPVLKCAHCVSILPLGDTSPRKRTVANCLRFPACDISSIR